MHQVLTCLRAMCKRVATPLALRVLAHAERGEWTDLQQIRIVPSDYLDSESYWRDAMCLDLLRKCDLPTNVDKVQEAIHAFYRAERKNADTNDRMQRFTHPLASDWSSEEYLALRSFIKSWRGKMRSLLGNPPSHYTPRFSGGATFGDRSGLTTIPDKMSNRPQWYKGTISTMSKSFYECGWGRALTGHPSSKPKIPCTVRGNIFFTVPKDGTKERGCAKEASLSVGFQLDVGRYLRVRLLKEAGIDLKHGQGLHSELARQGSFDGSLATLDMSQASDHWATKVVELVTPERWFSLLDSLRARFTRVGKSWVKLEKFSSMGNGFTFELETCLFLTLAQTVVEGEGGDPKKVWCYGDDLIVETPYARSVLAALRFFGHLPNEKKSFAEGPFRESCGGDFYSGVPVTTCKLESLPDEPQQWIAFANTLRRVCAGMPQRWALIKPVWNLALRNIPEQIRKCRGPESLGDLVIADDERFWWSKGTGYDQSVRTYSPVGKILPWSHFHPIIQMICTTLCESRGVSPRGSVRGYRLGWSYVHRNDWLPEPAPQRVPVQLSLDLTR